MEFEWKCKASKLLGREMGAGSLGESEHPEGEALGL